MSSKSKKQAEQPSYNFILDPSYINPWDCQEISTEIRKNKYKAPSDTDIISTINRVVEGVCAEEFSTYRGRLFEAMITGCWLPGGRIWAGAGLNRSVTLMNCYVDRTIEDSMDGIADALKDAMLTQQQGGGIGMDFSTLRPSGAWLSRTEAIASGPLPFMDMWDAMCSTIMSAGARRGAMMATMHCEHPDLIEFIHSKRKAGRLTNFNISVLVTDAFMDAIKNDDTWYLGFGVPRADNQHVGVVEKDDGSKWYIYSEHKARDLWDMIISNTYEYAEPGVIFIDRVNDWNSLNYCEEIQCTNPCGEQPLPPNGCCNLGAVNLAMMIQKPFTKDATFNYDLLRSTTDIGVTFLDNVIEATKYPLHAQAHEEAMKRRIGIGITGLADAMAMLGITYGSETALAFTESVMSTLCNQAFKSSALLARDRGPFPLYHPDKWGADSPVVAILDQDVKDLIKQHGVRNGVLLTIAPTGTTSILCGNVSSGLEPIFSLITKRKVRKGDSWKEHITYDYAALMYKQITGMDPLGYAPFITADQLDVKDHLRIQAVCQKYVDASISKTINCPKDMSFEDFKLVYWDAYEMGCKGCTTYRPSEVRGSILEAVDANGVPLEQGQQQQQVGSTPTLVEQLPNRPEELSGRTYKIKWPSSPSAYYVTINDYDGKPYEIFISSTAATHQDWATALSLMISAILRKGGNVNFVGEELQKVVSATDSAWMGGKWWGSLVARIGAVIQHHVESLRPTPPEEPSTATSISTSDVVTPPIAPVQGERCPKCSAPTLIRAEGCKKCLNCYYSSCA